jgi:two-component system, sensor histidine kinase
MNLQTPVALIDADDPESLRRRVEALERENVKLKRINTVLMERVERSMDFQGGAFSLFQTAIVLERKVRERTLELEKTLQELESSHADLARAKEMAELMRERLSEAIESVNEGFALFDADDRLLLCNSKYLACWPELLGRISPGMRFREIAEMAALSRSVRAANPRPDLWLNNRMAQRAELNGPYIHRLSDGRWLQVTERRTRDGGIVGLYTDITDIKENETRRREEELAAKSALLQATLDNIAQGVSVYDHGEKLAAWNDRFVELLRLPQNVARADACFADLVVYNSALGDRGLPVAALTAADAVVEQTVFGDTVLEIRRSAMPDGGFVLTFTDITERKKAEEALRDGERRIRLITDTVPALIAYVDAEQRYRFVNHAYEECFNLLRCDLEGRTMTEALGPDQYALRHPHILNALAGKQAHFEIQMPTENSRPRYAVATYVPHFGERREVLGFFALIHDITERRRVAEELRDAKESLERRVIERTAELTRLNGQLQQEITERAAAEDALKLAKAEADTANLSKTKFLAAASHDLLQPLNAARLFVSALMDMEQPGGQRSLVENLDGALTSVEDLLSALLDISRLDAGAVRPEVSDFPIKSLLSALSSEYTAVALDRSLRLKVMPCAAIVHSDPRLLRRIVQNFLSNALRYTQSGRVLLGCRRRRHGLVIEVWDTGPGIPADKLREVFEEFRRLDSPTPHGRDRGIGLGLAIVDRVARMLGHDIQVRSEYRRGSVFSVTVPYGSFAPRAARPVKQIGQRLTNRLDGLTVLVLDNEPAVIAGMRALLEGWSCSVMTAATGDEALAAIARRGGPPDLLIADYHLDDGALGIDEIVRIRKAVGRPVPAVLVTANRTPELVAEAKNLNLPVLNKPVKPAQLRALISGIVG